MKKYQVNLKVVHFVLASLLISSQVATTAVKAGENQVGVMAPNAVMCNTIEQMQLFLKKGSRVLYETDPLPEVAGCRKVTLSVPVVWSDHSQFVDDYATALIIEIATPEGIMYAYRDYVRLEGKEI